MGRKSRKERGSHRRRTRRTLTFLGGWLVGFAIIAVALVALAPEPPPEPETLEIPVSSPAGLLILALLLVVTGLWAVRQR